MISRALLHGKRRAEEMREVAVTVAEAGLEPLMSSATAERQDWAAHQGALMGKDAIETDRLEPFLDLLAQAGRKRAAE